MDTNPNISRLLEMLDNPSAYSEQEIYDCIHSDEETLETYRCMVAAKQAYWLKQTHQPADTEVAWQQLMNLMTRSARRDAPYLENEESRIARNEELYSPTSTEGERENSEKHILPEESDTVHEGNSYLSLFTFHFSLKRIAAIFLAAAFLGGLAWAFVPLLHTKEEASQTAEVTTLPLEGERGGGLLSFSNLPLDSILAVVSAHYNCEVCFRDSAAMGMKFITTWNPEDSLAAFIEHLNMFDGLRLTLQDDTIFVESTNDEEGAQ